MLKLVQRCVVCGEKKQISVSQESLDAYHNGVLVQDAFPLMTKGDREFFFLSKVCPKCWLDMFVE